MAVPEANSQHDADRVPLGQLLVDSGLLDAADLERVLEEQRRTGAPLGRMLVDGGYVASSTIAMALADQHGGLLKTEYGFATGRPSATQRTARPERRAVRCLAAAAASPSRPRNRSRSRRCCSPPSRRLADRSRARRAGPTSSLRRPAGRPRAGAGRRRLPSSPSPSWRSCRARRRSSPIPQPVLVADERDQLAGKLAAAELERDALRNRLDEAHQARRAAEEAAQASTDAARESLAVLQQDADAAAAALTIARDELAAARLRLQTSKRASPSPPSTRPFMRRFRTQAEAAAAGVALAEARARSPSSKRAAEPAVDEAVMRRSPRCRRRPQPPGSRSRRRGHELEDARTKIAELEAAARRACRGHGRPGVARRDAARGRRRG